MLGEPELSSDNPSASSVIEDLPKNTTAPEVNSLVSSLPGDCKDNVQSPFPTHPPWLLPPWPPPSSDTLPLPSDTFQDEVVVCRLKSPSMLSVSITVGGKVARAVVDTAAEVTILSDRIYDSLRPKPPIIKNVTLNTAGRNMKMKGMIVGPVEMTLGDFVFQEIVYIAPIDDDMLLGVDLLRKHHATINIPNSSLSFQGKDVLMTSGKPSEVSIAQVFVERTVIIPRWCVKLVKCRMNRPLKNFFIEPVSNLVGFVPRSFYSTDEIIDIYVLNPTEQNLKWKQNEIVAEAQEAVIIEPHIDDSSDEAIFVQKVNLPSDVPIPSHLEDLWERSVPYLSPAEQKIVRNLLIEFEGVFAKDDFDLGDFNELDHPIDTGEARPIKLKMRRTPMNFVQEEKAHLNKMSAGVIKPSVSEWASAPVLIRKRDGGVRWCLDYRRLNQVTKKDVYPLPCIEECLDTLSGSTWFSKLDANSAYWQVKVRKEDREKTAFVTKYGLFEFVRMGFGLCNALATFSRVMSLILRGLTWDIALAFWMMWL